MSNQPNLDQNKLTNYEISTFENRKLSRKASTYVDLELAKIEAGQLLSGENAQSELKKNLLFEEKSISLWRLYTHLCYPIDYLYVILGSLGSIGSGVTMPLLAYMMSDIFSDIGNTSESITPDQVEQMRSIVKKSMNKQIKKTIIFHKYVKNFFTYIMPLAFVNYFPLLYVIGRTENKLYMISPIVSILFIIPCYVVWRIGVRKYKSTGS